MGQEGGPRFPVSLSIPSVRARPRPPSGGSLAGTAGPGGSRRAEARREAGLGGGGEAPRLPTAPSPARGPEERGRAGNASRRPAP